MLNFVGCVAVLIAISVGLAGCPLDPAKVPPCSGREVWPDPCAGGPRDAGRE